MSTEIEEIPQRNGVLREILSKIAGEHGLEIADALSKGEATDEELAKKLNIQLNLVRKILYDLYDNRVVSYRRVRDDNTGWYVYYWKMEPDRAIELFMNNKRILLNKLEERLKFERNNMFFSCKNKCPRLTFDEATEYDFKCPRCGEELEPFDNRPIIDALERQMGALRREFLES
ncbi:MAG: transcription factor E [Hadesarchaea archaeon]|nr:transcription factor E [Hadesarchaea archaeon]